MRHKNESSDRSTIYHQGGHASKHSIFAFQTAEAEVSPEKGKLPSVIYRGQRDFCSTKRIRVVRRKNVVRRYFIIDLSI